jgi:hypothetical protein
MVTSGLVPGCDVLSNSQHEISAEPNASLPRFIITMGSCYLAVFNIDTSD